LSAGQLAQHSLDAVYRDHSLYGQHGRETLQVVSIGDYIIYRRMVFCVMMTALTNTFMFSVFNNRSGNLNIHNLFRCVVAAIHYLTAASASFSPDVLYACWLVEKSGRSAFVSRLATWALARFLAAILNLQKPVG
jgi:hypothetical protein